MKIISIVGARPQFIKVKPLIDALKKFRSVKHVLIHTGQHYDFNMSEVFFRELSIPSPDYHLGVGAGTHAFQTAEIMKRAETALLREKPDWVVVYGDTNSTLSGALVAAKMKIPLAHVESGLRSFTLDMPEEINRVLTDRISTVLFCPTVGAVRNLEREGFKNILNGGKLIEKARPGRDLYKKIPLVVNSGDIMYEAFRKFLAVAVRSDILSRLKLQPKEYYLATVHRAGNTDDRSRLTSIVDTLVSISAKKTVIWPVHPRTRRLLSGRIPGSLRIIAPLGYFDMLMLEKNACRILTDSGGVQREAYWLGVPCMTLRRETEWTETVGAKTNRVTDIDGKKIADGLRQEAFCDRAQASASLFGTGRTAELIIEILVKMNHYAKRERE
jgi:UDP-N-acetylglucosamine 2-epimerase